MGGWEDNGEVDGDLDDGVDGWWVVMVVMMMALVVVKVSDNDDGDDGEDDSAKDDGHDGDSVGVDEDDDYCNNYDVDECDGDGDDKDDNQSVGDENPFITLIKRNSNGSDHNNYNDNDDGYMDSGISNTDKATANNHDIKISNDITIIDKANNNRNVSALKKRC